MLVIKGKSKKAKHIENLIRKDFMTDRVVVLDAVGSNGWLVDDWATIRTMDSKMTHKQIINAFENDYEEFKEFDWVVFHVNSNKESLKDFIELDRKYPQNFITTIQSHEGITTKFFV